MQLRSHQRRGRERINQKAVARHSLHMGIPADSALNLCLRPTTFAIQVLDVLTSADGLIELIHQYKKHCNAELILDSLVQYRICPGPRITSADL